MPSTWYQPRTSGPSITACCGLGSGQGANFYPLLLPKDGALWCLGAARAHPIGFLLVQDWDFQCASPEAFPGSSPPPSLRPPPVTPALTSEFMFLVTSEPAPSRDVAIPTDLSSCAPGLLSTPLLCFLILSSVRYSFVDVCLTWSSPAESWDRRKAEYNSVPAHRGLIQAFFQM